MHPRQRPWVRATLGGLRFLRLLHQLCLPRAQPLPTRLVQRLAEHRPDTVPSTAGTAKAGQDRDDPHVQTASWLSVWNPLVHRQPGPKPRHTHLWLPFQSVLRLQVWLQPTLRNAQNVDDPLLGDRGKGLKLRQTVKFRPCQSPATTTPTLEQPVLRPKQTKTVP